MESINKTLVCLFQPAKIGHTAILRHLPIRNHLDVPKSTIHCLNSCRDHERLFWRKRAWPIAADLKEYTLLPIIKAVTFDAGDTLIHPWVHKTRRFAYLCEQIGITLAPDAAKLAAVACERFFQERYQGPSKHLEWWLTHHVVGLQAAGVQGNLRQLAQDIHEVWNQLPDTWVLDPEAIITLECLRQRGIRLAVISNWDGNLRQTLQDLNILSYFEMVLDSHVVGVRKPDPAIFRIFSQACKLEPAQCIHVGDSPDADELLALSVGAISVLYDPLECLPSRGYRISKLSDVVEFIPRWNQ